MLNRIFGWQKSSMKPKGSALNITCDPPLASTTVLPLRANETTWSILLEYHESEAAHSWEVAIWHDLNSKDDWETLPLEEAKDLPVSFITGAPAQDARRKYFTGTLKGRPSRSKPLHFTVKYRHSPDHPWRWAKEDFGRQDGEVIYPEEPPEISKLEDYIEGLNRDLDINVEISEAPNTQVWTLTAAAPGAQGHSPGTTKISLGRPRLTTRWMAIVRPWSPWISPEHGKATFSPQKDAVLCSFLREDGMNLVFLALSGLDNVLAFFKSDGNGNVVCVAQNDSAETGIAKMVVSVGLDSESAVAAVMYQARKIVREAAVSSGSSLPAAPRAADVKTTWMQTSIDGLTYCTWNALGRDLSEKKILDTLETLKRHDIQITNLIIDDNWQSLDHEGKGPSRRGWLEFEADKKHFPHGLKHTVSMIRERNKNIYHIAVWHGIFGYWGGIAPKSKLASEYKTVDVHIKTAFHPPPGIMRVVAAEDVGRFYDDFYTFLNSSGINSVKADTQFFLDDLERAEDRRNLIKSYQDAWTVARLRHFHNNAISYFFPDVPDSHPWHIFCNAHNSILTQHLNVIPDWDMFQTSHPWSSYHAAARCISGGPVTITDKPGKHDLDLIKQMTAQTVYGETVTLRPDVPGKTTRAYVGYDEKALLKVGTYVGRRRTGTGILGAFNGTGKTITEFIRLAEIPGTIDGEEYIIRSHTKGQISPVMTLKSPTSPLFAVTLPIKGWEIFSAYPLQSFNAPSKKEDEQQIMKITNLGLLGKMTGAAAVLHSNYTSDRPDRVELSTSLKALGTLESTTTTTSREDNKEQEKEMVLEIDLAKAWQELEIEPGWSNEVSVQIFIYWPSQD
ncbi:MAG: hypothetical protein M1823_000119 [Watsoniomyces obsoletus]|nr:MAG: hypothetical protein M1823_000119 [Watsoniomyces obsoletus]